MSSEQDHVHVRIAIDPMMHVCTFVDALYNLMVTTKNVEETFEFKECMYIQTAGAPVHLVNMYLVLCHMHAPYMSGGDRPAEQPSCITTCARQQSIDFSVFLCEREARGIPTS